MTMEVIQTIFFVLGMFLSMLLVYLFFGGIQFKNSRWAWLLCVGSTILGAVLFKIMFKSFDDDVIALLIIWLIVFVVEKTSIKRVLGLYIFNYVTILLLNLGIIYYFRYLYFLHFISKEINQDYSMISQVISVVILGILLILKRKKMGKQCIYLSNKQYFILYTVLFIATTMTAGVNHYYVPLIHLKKEAVLIGMMTITSSIILILLAVYQIFLAQNYHLLMENFHLQKQFHAMQEIYFENIFEQSKQTRTFRHDMKAHLQTIRQLAMSKDDNDIVGYIDKIQQLAHFDRSYYFTGNQIIDILLSEIVQQAQEKQIKVNINGIIPNDLNLDLVDLTSICYNLLQNALEATIREKGSEFSVNFSVKNQQFVFVVKNRISEKMRIDEGKLKSRKKDIKNHGLGLKNVYDAVERSKGIFDITIQNQQFVARVVLPCE